MDLLDESPFFRSQSAEVFRGMSGGEVIAVKVLAFCLSDNPSRLNKVSILSRPSTPHVTEHRLAVV